MYDIYHNNEYIRTVYANSWKQARDWFKDAYRGDYRSRDFKVKKVS